MIEERSWPRLAKNALARFSALGWARLLALILVAVVGRYAGAAGLGQYALVLTVVGIVGTLADAGLNLFLTREAARAGTSAEQTDLLGAILPLKGTMVIMAVALWWLICWLVPLSVEVRPLFLLGSLILPPEALTGAMVALINARQRMEVSGALSMAIRLLTLAGGFWALVQGFGVAGVLLVSVATGILGVLGHGVVLWRWELWPILSWNVGRWPETLHRASPFALTALIAVAYSRADLLLLGAWQGEVVAGWYSAGYKLWEAIGLVPASILDAMFPEMSRLSARPAGAQQLAGLRRTGGRVLLVVGIALALVGTFWAGDIIDLVYGRRGDYRAAVPVFRLLMWAIPAMFLYLLNGHILYAVGQQGVVTRRMLIVGVTNILLNLIVIPRWSYLGAAVVAVVSEWLLWRLLASQFGVKK